MKEGYSMKEKGSNDNKVENETRLPYTILVVEDDAGSLRLIQRNLRRAGFHTEGVSNGTEAIAWVVDNPTTTLMLLDYRLPDMTGKQLLETLAEQQCSVPFIIMTGYGDERTAVEMMKLGARDYLVKDIGFLDLLPTVVEQVVEQLATEKRLADAEEALRQSEKNFRNIFKFVPESLLAINNHVEILNSNKAFEELLRKYSPALNMSEGELREIIVAKLRQHFGKMQHGIIEIDRNPTA